MNDIVRTYVFGALKVICLSIGAGVVEAYTENKVKVWVDLLSIVNHAALMSVPIGIGWFMRGPLDQRTLPAPQSPPKAGG
jgi:hypothetical protein